MVAIPVLLPVAAIAVLRAGGGGDQRGGHGGGSGGGGGKGGQSNADDAEARAQQLLDQAQKLTQKDKP
jgi:hypothetical protein